MATPTSLPVFHDAKRAAEILGISYGTLRNWVHEGRIECSKIGSRLRFTDEQLATAINVKPAKGGDA